MNQVLISMIAVQKEHVANNKGGYDVLNCTYKVKFGNQEKVEAKKLFSFTISPVAFKKLEDSKMGDVFTITREKNEKGYWDWKDAVEGVQNSGGTDMAANSAGEANKATGAVASGRSAFETPEEREFRQTMIVRQSCLAQSVAYVGQFEDTPTVDTVLQIAEQFEQWVIRKE